MNDLQLQCFLSVANTLSFARAAKMLNVSQPTITHQIKTLEDELNTKLFYRSTRLVELTAEGKSFISDAKNILAISGQAKLRFSNPKDNPFEILTVGCSNYILLSMLSDVLASIRELYPNLHPRFSVLPHEQLRSMIENDRLDIVFDINKEESVKEGIKYTELSSTPLVCVKQKETDVEEARIIGIEELKNNKLILSDPVGLAPDISELQFRLADGIRRSDLHFCASPEEACLLAKAGYGVAVLPKLYIKGRSKSSFCELEGSPNISFGLIYKQSPGDSIKKDFVRIAKEHFVLE